MVLTEAWEELSHDRNAVETVIAALAPWSATAS